ncbi:type 2 lantipeptide synthetase LanM family protein [Archangium violaceum]|uniref:type 2 lanthipeptide synthetase LanM family protein n=1 Tax=Archangium violaceum TaxID=83451 RepID=UPI00193B234A|nr:type 2 lanthipeptide synthetase LanM family protein [Archangium violaceum]QRK04683.1 type 2 lantipeptide synthetase LanM family protein [Archangium violaceum]
MSPHPIDAASWYQSLTLLERLSLLRKAPGVSPLEPAQAELAGRRAHRWRTQAPFSEANTLLQERLALDGIREDEWLHLLGEPIEAVQARCSKPPSWLRDFVSAYEQPAPGGLIPVHEPQKLRGKSKDAAGLLISILPLMRQARDRLRAGLQEIRRAHPDAPFENEALERLFLAGLQGPLINKIDRTLVLEMHVARVQGQLQGDTAEERYASFLERLRRPEIVLALFQEYPVLARQLSIGLEQWVTYSLEFTRHLCADWSELRARFSPGADPGGLVSLDIGAGDRHRGGRSVILVGFSGGLRLVYKPKALAADSHFQQLITWLDERGAQPGLRTISVLDRGTYGWLEFVPAESCTSEAQVRRFYERQGAITMLLYLLGATDFHYENIIAAGEHPVLIDLETLFHPYTESFSATSAHERAQQSIVGSVLRSGLLPQWIWGNKAALGIEISGLGAHKGQKTPFGAPSWESAGTDGMRLQRQPSEVPEGHNRPKLNGADVQLLDYTEAIVAGFTAMYQWVLEHREELLSPAGPLARFADDEVRILLRPTQRYGQILSESFHPDLLRNALDRERHVDRLWFEMEQSPALRRVIAAERSDLHNGDIPMFFTRPGSRDLWTSDKVRLEGFFESSGMEVVERTLKGLGEPDLLKQVGFIRASLATLDLRKEGRRERRTTGASEPGAVAGRAQLLAAARAVGDRLEALAVRGDQDACWVGLLPQGRAYALSPVDTNLYGGTAGIALFLGYLGAVTGEARYTQLSRAALRSMLRQVERNRDTLTGIGVFDGWGSVLYTLSHLGTLWNEPALLEEAHAVVERLQPLIERDDAFDVVAGAAGCIASLLSLNARAPSARTLEAARACGERLVARAQPMKKGVAWPSAMEVVVAPLTGFAHGTAGIAWALLQLATLTGEERFRSLALSALAYERDSFVPEEGNWTDWRKDENSPSEERAFVAAWCHGAPGIGLSRLGMLPHLDDADTRAELDVALKTTLARGFSDNHSLCHGDLGVLDVLLTAREALGEVPWHAEVERRAASVLASIERQGWICGTPRRIEAPGLMMGIAGIGYGLLRLAEPGRVPSVLLLSPPVPG